jgi:gentisate 1,2-dioxygenase
MTTSFDFASPVGDLMPAHPRSKALPHRWRWDALRALAARAGELVPVGRGGERRSRRDR